MRCVACCLILAVPVLAAAEEPAPANLAELLAELDRANPELLAGGDRVRGALEVPTRAQALPDPKLSVSYTNDSLDDFTLGSSEFSNLTIGWEQDVPRKSVRDAASGIAKADVEVAKLSVAGTRARLRARIIASYADLYRLDRTADLLDESRELLSVELSAARARYEAGTGTQESLLRAQAGRRRLEVEREEIRRERRASELALNTAIGRDASLSIGPANLLPAAALPADVDALVAAAAETSPALREAAGRTVRAEAVATDAKAGGKPELSWLAAYQFRGGLDPMIVGGLGIRLPVWKKHSQLPRIAETEAQLSAARHDQDSAALQVRAEALAAVNDVASADRRLVLYRQGLIPEDMTALDAARMELSAGTAGMGAVLDALGRLLGDQRDAAALEASRLQSLARLEAATGVTLVEVTP